MINQFYQYLADNRNEEIEEVLPSLQCKLLKLGLALSMIENEWGPGQLEVIIGVMPAMKAGSLHVDGMNATGSPFNIPGNRRIVERYASIDPY